MNFHGLAFPALTGGRALSSAGLDNEMSSRRSRLNKKNLLFVYLNQHSCTFYLSRCAGRTKKGAGAHAARRNHLFSRYSPLCPHTFKVQRLSLFYKLAPSLYSLCKKINATSESEQIYAQVREEQLSRARH